MSDHEHAAVLRRWLDTTMSEYVVGVVPAIERAIEKLDNGMPDFDTRYLCTKGHHVVSKRPDLDTCPAELPWPRTEATTVCGAQLSVYQEEWADV